jgi:hypothetical protein
MRKYQVRLFNSLGALISAVEVEWPDDAAAREMVGRLAGMFPIELGEGERLVARYEVEPRKLFGEQRVPAAPLTTPDWPDQPPGCP